MGRTLLIGRSGSSWHEWLATERKGRDLILLDPADAHYGPAGRLSLIQGDRIVRSSFYGSLDPQRAPHLIASALGSLLDEAGADAVVQCFAYRPLPLLRQLAITLAFQVRPERLLIEKDLEIDHDGWPIGPEEVEPRASLPPLVVDAQRKAQWLKLLERCSPHTIPLQGCSVQGLRLGSGRLIDELTKQRAGLEHELHVEVCGSTLFIVAEGQFGDERIGRAMDMTHVARAQVVNPGDYEDLLCAFVRPNGDEFGYGMIERIDFSERRIYARCDAIPPVPVPILRVGSLRVDSDGREHGDVRPWQV